MAFSSPICHTLTSASKGRCEPPLRCGSRSTLAALAPPLDPDSGRGGRANKKAMPLHRFPQKKGETHTSSIQQTNPVILVHPAGEG